MLPRGLCTTVPCRPEALAQALANFHSTPHAAPHPISALYDGLLTIQILHELLLLKLRTLRIMTPAGTLPEAYSTRNSEVPPEQIHCNQCRRSSPSPTDPLSREPTCRWSGDTKAGKSPPTMLLCLCLLSLFSVWSATYCTYLVFPLRYPYRLTVRVSPTTAREMSSASVTMLRLLLA